MWVFLVTSKALFDYGILKPCILAATVHGHITQSCDRMKHANVSEYQQPITEEAKHSVHCCCQALQSSVNCVHHIHNLAPWLLALAALSAPETG